MIKVIMNKKKLVLLVCSLVVILDQLSKYLVRADLPLYSKISIFPFLNFTHIRNTGVAFGMLQNLPETIKIPFFIAVFALAIFVIVLILKKTDEKDKLVICCLALILGGAIGNSIDRIRLGYVTDFIDFHWFGNPAYHWPPFNIADSSITVGAVLLIFLGIFYSRGKR